MNLNKNCYSLLILFAIILFYSSCSESKKQTSPDKIISEWIDKQIIFPSDVKTNNALKDSFAAKKLFASEYRVLLYLDSVGCTGCRLKLFNWKRLIKETEEDFEDKVSFLFYFHPKNKEELQFLFMRDKFDYPVFIDENNSINRLNSFPVQAAYQCFLLDRDNKVLALGNPVLNPKVWNLYKDIISGKTRQ